MDVVILWGEEVEVQAPLAAELSNDPLDCRWPDGVGLNAHYHLARKQTFCIDLLDNDSWLWRRKCDAKPFFLPNHIEIYDFKN